MPEVSQLQPDQSFAQGRFVLIKRLGRGGMGEVWLARDERLHEQAALKFLPPEIRSDAVALDDLRRETSRSHRLSHPNIVRIHDLHEDADGTAFIVMEYIDGPTVAALRIEQPARVFSWDYLRPLVAQLCAALEYAHGEKIIHRDLKPANLMVDSKGWLKLADFGIAAVASDSMSRVSIRHSTSGTLPYMSPQQVTGKPPQATDDIYELGATLYELLSGKPPFYTGDLTHQILNEPPEPMDERLAFLQIENIVPPEVSAMVMACLAKEPGQRPQSARVVAEWIGVELVVKPSTESLASAFFPQTPSSPEPAAVEAGGEGRSKPARFGRNLLAVGILVLVMTAAFWLNRDRFLGRNSGALITTNISSQSETEIQAKTPSAGTPLARAANPQDSITQPTVLSAPLVGASGQNATSNQTLTPGQPAAKLKEKWTKALEDARRDFQSSNDRESAEFVGTMLAELGQPGGMAPAMLAGYGERMKKQVRALVRNGVLESAATLNYAQLLVLKQPNPAPGPLHPHHKTGGVPGPGGLVLYLPFDKPDDNGVVHDESGAGNDGQVFGAKWVAEGKFGGACQFSITNITDRIVIPNSDTLNPNYITLSAWVKAADHDGFWNRIVDKDFHTGYCLELGGDSNGKAHRGKLAFDSPKGYLETGRVLNDNKWHHVAATYDGKETRLYLDGYGPNPLAGRTSGSLTKSSWDLCIGNSVADDGTGEFIAFDGLIDEVRIYNRALSPDEIKALTTATHAGADILPPPVPSAIPSISSHH